MDHPAAPGTTSTQSPMSMPMPMPASPKLQFDSLLPELDIGQVRSAHRSALMSTTPRVPSALRKVVDTKDESDTESAGEEYGRRRSLRIGSAAPTRGPGGWDADLALMPALRKEHSEPALTYLVNRPSSSVRCLPYPHTLDSYERRPRPSSVGAAPSAPYRFSIVTTNQAYTEYSYKKGAD
ncbi:hypothetical protein IWW55_003864, partial [Coemansia sp. RSA 2706]